MGTQNEQTNQAQINWTKIFSVYDDKAEAFLPPFFAMTQGVALRTFHQAATDENHQFCKHAADYTLFEIGQFDENTGTIEGHQNIKNVGNALTIKDIQ